MMVMSGFWLVAEVADQIVHLNQSQYTDTGSTSPSTDPITPGRVATGVPVLCQ